VNSYIQILKHAIDPVVITGSLKRLALDLTKLKQFTLDFPLQEGWVAKIEKYLLEAGMATTKELEALKANVNNVRVDFKNENNEPLNLQGTFKFDPSLMTASYGPYVVDDVFKDEPLSLDMVDGVEDSDESI
jgi:hypothetical protein